MNLNPDQQRVVDSDHHCLVVACPGSGKTRVISTKIQALLERHPNSRVCAVTFTRDSAGELTRRVEADIGSARLNHSCRIGTFHSLAIRQLRNHGKLGKVLGPQEQMAFLRRAIGMTDPSMERDEAVAVLERAKGSLSECAEQKSDLYVAYQGLLAKNKVTDLYDVIRNSVQWMKDGSIHPFPVQFMLVDEFQDTDGLQLEWVLEHAKNGTAVTVVGDDDQSIYGWRGALGYGGMQAFMEATAAERITLGINYRCREEVLRAADHLIQCNQARIDKSLIAGRGPGGRVEAVRCASRPDEAEQAVQAIQEDCVRLVDQGGARLFNLTVPAGSWAVLARGRRLLDGVENLLQARGIQYYRPPSESFWSRTPQSFMLGLLSNLEDGGSAGIDNALNHALSSRFGRSKANHAMNNLHEQFGAGLSDLFNGGSLNLKAFMADETEIIVGLLKNLESWRQQLALGRMKLAIRGVAAWFASFESGDDVDSITRAGETVCQLNGSLRDRVNLLLGITASQRGAPQGVQLHTMHGSKGLEFNKVWIIGADAEVIPSAKSPDYEEERRLMYVAITRAKDLLYTSSLVTTSPSPFLDEARIQVSVPA